MAGGIVHPVETIMSGENADDNLNEDSVIFLAETKKPRVRKRQLKIVLKEQSVSAVAEKKKLQIMKRLYPKRYKRIQGAMRVVLLEGIQLKHFEMKRS